MNKYYINHNRLLVKYQKIKNKSIFKILVLFSLFFKK